MERVALFLQTKAIGSRADTDTFDLFGRSAFNRYYYSMFLQVKEMLVLKSPDWDSVAHKSIPELLKGTVAERLKRAGKKTQRIGDSEGNILCRKAVSAAQGLSALMIEGYASRVVADYNPAILIVASGTDRFTLNNVSINSAHGWPTKTRQFTPIILRAWRLVDE